MIDLTELPTYGERRTVADIVEVAWLPALLGLITAASTWLIWYYTHVVCTPHVAALTGCNPGSIAEYINVDVFGRMLTYGGLAGGIGGFWRYDMIKKERAARIAAQLQVVELQKQLEEQRARNTAAREEAIRQAEEAIRQAAEDRRLADERAAEERRQAAEDRQALLAALSDLTAEIAHLRRQRNGDAQNGH